MFGCSAPVLVLEVEGEPGKLSELPWMHVKLAQRMPEPPRGAVGFEGVVFHYPARPDLPALEDVSIDVAPGDRFLLCSDGLTGQVPERDIEAVLVDHGDPGLAAGELVRRGTTTGEALVAAHGNRMHRTHGTPRAAPRGGGAHGIS